MYFKTLMILFLMIFMLGISFSSALAAEQFKIKQPVGQFGFYVAPGALGCSGDSAEGIVEKIVKTVAAVFYTVGAIGVLVFFLWGAVEWIFSGGDKEKVASARKRITNAVIGLVLLSLSYFILRVVSLVSGFDIFGPLQILGVGPIPICDLGR